MVKEGEIFKGTYYFDDYQGKHLIIMNQVHHNPLENDYAELVKLVKNHQNGEIMQARLLSINEDDEMFAEEV